MKRLSATSAALTAAVVTAAVALPAAASTGTSNGGASATPPPQDQSTQAQSAQYQPAKATWYGPGLYGNRLACGGRLSRSTLGVAHKSLPCGTKVALRYRGRTVVVPVIDRGPYARGVSYDLTQATARKLGVTQTTHLSAAPLDD